MFVSSNKGTVIQINTENKVMECVFRLHDQCINSMIINDGFCITGSDDGYVRVWPLDFSDYYLEANHDIPINSLDISKDNMEIIVGTKSGIIGVLNISSHKHITLSRSHYEKVLSIQFSPNGKELLTTSEDGTLRLWDVDTCCEIREFKSKSKISDISSINKYDLAMCSAFHPDGNLIAVGFESGIVKIVDIKTQQLIKQVRQHGACITSLIYHFSGHYLYSSSNDGGICIYDAIDNYSPLNMTQIKGPLGIPMTSMVMNDLGTRLGFLVPQGLEIIIYDCITLLIKNRISPPYSNKSKIRTVIMPDDNNLTDKLTFTNIDFVHGLELITILSNNEMRCYNVDSGERTRSYINFI